MSHIGITLLSTEGKTLSEITSERIGTMMKEKDGIREGEAAFGPNHSCVDHVNTLGKRIQGTRGEDVGLTEYCFFPAAHGRPSTQWRKRL